MKYLMRSAAAIAFAVTASAANAADLAEAVPAAPVAPDVVSYSWTGGYVGIHGGYNFAAGDDDNDGFGVDFDRDGIFNETGDDLNPVLLFSILNGDDEDEDDNWEVGVRAGYDWQAGAFLVGAVADLNWMGSDDDDDFDRVGDQRARDNFTGFSYGFSNESEDDWYATARLRAGFAADRVLIYGTAGLAFGFGGNDDDSVVVTNDPSVGPANVVYTNFGDDDDSDIGYAVGGGVEALVTSNVSVGLEYLYVNLDGFGGGDDSLSFATITSPAGGITFNLAADEEDEHDFHTVRLGVNYRFGGDDAPVAASY